MRFDISTDTSSKDFLDCISETAQILADTQAENIGLSMFAAHSAGSLANDVEFWRWIGKNYHCLDNAQSIQEKVINAPDWVSKQLQGKGYEWDFMTQQRGMLRNLFARFDAGTNPTQPGIDITKTNLFTGETLMTYQNKAYTSGQTPKLDHTPKSVPVVTNTENVQAVEEMGYEVIPFQDNATIKSQTQKRLLRAEKGTAFSQYTPKAVVGTMVKAGVGAAVLGIGIETIASYKKYKRGELSKKEYVIEIIKSGSVAATTGAGTTGIMIPISGVVTAAGIAQPWLIPVSFIISAALNKVVAPMFRRGDYAKLLGEATYYQSLAELQTALMLELEYSAEQFSNFITMIEQQKSEFNAVSSINAKLIDAQKAANDRLSALLDTI